MDVELTRDEAVLTVRSDRRSHPPYGIEGGEAGFAHGIVMPRPGLRRARAGLLSRQRLRGQRLLREQHLRGPGQCLRRWRLAF